MPSKKVDQLTERQKTVLEGIVQGKSFYVIGCDLGISEAGVRDHMDRIYKRIGVNNRTAAAVAYLKHLNPGMKTRAIGM
ncbi:LuxR C-terminal-related transcriptional regulator [Neptuniibacter sp.]|uniref:LuxR C-terminal-related transcriptional regulator n=1 Tax=Neptuniibacter sp. TaxID=1962643 RepID=UPI002612252D|nr:LuxR C-terminal-related transcriptional regulator [Neptuniibacter sp.]MCP4597768.1 response regulator transcription factor [Neptuniibacter sp.]